MKNDLFSEIFCVRILLGIVVLKKKDGPSLKLIFRRVKILLFQP